MTDRLWSILNFTGVAVGATQTIAHGLSVGGIGPLVPDLVTLQFPSSFEFVSATTTNLTIRNTSNPGGACQALCQAIHPVERSFGLSPDDGTFQQHLVPQPFCPGSPNGSGGTAVVTDGETIEGDGTSTDPIRMVIPLIAAARVNGFTGGVLFQSNTGFASIVQGGVGVYQLFLTNPPADRLQTVPLATRQVSSAGSISASVLVDESIQVNVFDSANAPEDIQFSIAVFVATLTPP